MKLEKTTILIDDSKDEGFTLERVPFTSELSGCAYRIRISDSNKSILLTEFQMRTLALAFCADKISGFLVDALVDAQ